MVSSGKHDLGAGHTLAGADTELLCTNFYALGSAVMIELPTQPTPARQRTESKPFVALLVDQL